MARKKIIKWFLGNIFLPVFAPPLIVFAVMTIEYMLCRLDVNLDPIQIFRLMVDKGVYAFLGISVLLSLLLDYNADKVIKGWVAIIWTIHILYLGIVFFNSLEQTDIFKNNINIFYTFTVSAIAFATLLKTLIVRYNINH